MITTFHAKHRKRTHSYVLDTIEMDFGMYWTHFITQSDCKKWCFFNYNWNHLLRLSNAYTPNRSLGFWRECVICRFPSPWCQSRINRFPPCETRLFMGMQTFHNKNVLESQETYRNVWWTKPNVVSLHRGSRENHFRTKHSVRTQTWSTPQ